MAGKRRLRWLPRLALAGAMALAGFAGFEWATWPDVAALREGDPATTAFIERYRARQRAAGRSDRVAWRPVPARRISPELKIAVLVAEDIDFFSHRGFATGEMKAALAAAWDDRRLPRGASTLTQQLAKNLWLSPSRNPWRKAKEALLTRELERTLGKARILELYLNVVELGPGLYGAEAAAGQYFGKSASALSAPEAAALAAALPKPSAWHPGSESRAYRRRVETVRRRMEKARGWLLPLVR
ncbi:MAG: monofunctional biosynthetic peptidoglycan transglycosylase [Acidobacteriota bacterium]|nr:monofunctional biosynthetic peptidoglycan transglycosylase [Acidobacteriota bacterium]